MSPINGQNPALCAALEAQLAAHGPALPVYLGNRNWHPLITVTVCRMREDGIRRAAVFVTAAFSGCSGCRQYREDLIGAQEAAGAGAPDHALVYQSRSGPRQVAWLEPDILDHLEARAAAGVTDVVVVPIGFVSDHVEVLYDLDVDAAERAAELGIELVRARTVGTAPRFIEMIRELLLERMSERPTRLALGRLGPSHDICPLDCCLIGGAGEGAAG